MTNSKLIEKLEALKNTLPDDCTFTEGYMDKAIAIIQSHEAEGVDAEYKQVGFTGSGSISSMELGGEGHIWGNSADAHPVPVYTKSAIRTPEQPQEGKEARGAYAKPHNQHLYAEPYAQPDKAEVVEWNQVSLDHIREYWGITPAEMLTMHKLADMGLMWAMDSPSAGSNSFGQAVELLVNGRRPKGPFPYHRKDESCMNAEDSGEAGLICKTHNLAILRAYQAALSALPPTRDDGDWQPIETAPRYKLLMLWADSSTPEMENWKMGVGSISDDGVWHWDGSRLDKPYHVKPTHWMPLPPPPKAQQAAGA